MSASFEDRVEATRAMTLAGLTAQVIADRLGVTTRSVERYRRVAGVGRPRTSVVVTPEMHDRLRTLLEDGCSAIEAARTVGCSARQVRARFPELVWTPSQVMEFANFMRVSA